MSSRRIQRVRELLKRAVGDIIQRDFSMEEVGLVSVTDVHVSPDLRNATVFIGVVGSEDQKRRAPRVIRGNLRMIQLQLGKAITLKRTPHLKIALDDSAERGVRVVDIIEELERKDAERAALGESADDQVEDDVPGEDEDKVD